MRFSCSNALLVSLAVASVIVLVSGVSASLDRSPHSHRGRSHSPSFSKKIPNEQGKYAEYPRSHRHRERAQSDTSRTRSIYGAYNPVPDPTAVVETQNARFTVLTPQLIRMEYSSTKSFTDSASFAVLNRNLAVPKFTWNVDSKNWLTITTSSLQLRYYTLATSSFNDSTLSVEIFKVGTRQNVIWNPSSLPTGNLGGTIRTLDDVPVALNLTCVDPYWRNDTHCEPGLASRDGWAILDDSDRPRYSPGQFPDQPWTTGPFGRPSQADSSTCAIATAERTDCNPGNGGGESACQSRGCCFAPAAVPTTPPRWLASGGGNASARKNASTDSNSNGIPWCFYPQFPVGQRYLDWYMFGYGHEYAAAVSDYAQIGGHIPLPPRYTLGPQFSRWFAYDDLDAVEIVEDHFAGNNIPLDVLVLDMDWHYTYDRPTPNPYNVTVKGWSGYTWDAHLFPVPDSFLAYLKRRNIFVTLNLHPSAGVQFVEQRYADMARAMGIDPATGQTVPFNITDPRYASEFMSIVMEPIQPGQGLAFWWIDWQQGETTWTQNVNPTYWLNYVFSSTQAAWAGHLRPWVMGRWGGMGNHRYPIGFSGDTFSTWELLTFQVEFTATASNVLYQWTHDIGGHLGQPGPEMFTRWVQFGLFSSTLRPHCNGKIGFTRDLWLYEYSAFTIMRRAYQLRSQLVPYIYAANYEAYRFGVPVIRPLYYVEPELDATYEYRGQYMFGPAFVVAPITRPADPATNVTAWPIIVPTGEWLDWSSGIQFTGPAVITRNFSLAEVPVLIRPGQIIPQSFSPSSKFASAVSSPTTMLLDISAHTQNSARLDPPAARWYDDDGLTRIDDNPVVVESTGTVDPDDLPKYLVTESTYRVSADGTGATLLVTPLNGSLPVGVPDTREYRIRLRNCFPPQSVRFSSGNTTIELRFNAHAYPDRFDPLSFAWDYDAARMSVWLHLGGRVPLTGTWRVDLDFDSASSPVDPRLSSVPFLRAVDRVQTCKEMLETIWGQAYTEDYYTMLDIPGGIRRISAALPADTHQLGLELDALGGRVTTAIAEIRALKIHPEQEYVRRSCLNLLQDLL